MTADEIQLPGGKSSDHTGPTAQSGTPKPKKTKFSSKRKFEEIEVDDVKYTVVAMTGTANEEYREAQLDRYEVNEDDPEKSVLVKIKGSYYDLFKRCVFKVPPAPSDKPTPLAPDVFAEWSDECCQEVMQVCRRVNAISEEGQADAKNS